MIKAILRFLMLNTMAFTDGLITIIFDKQEICRYQYLVKPITISQTQKEQVLVEYLKKYHKQVYKDKSDGKKGRKNKKETDA